MTNKIKVKIYNFIIEKKRKDIKFFNIKDKLFIIILNYYHYYLIIYYNIWKKNKKKIFIMNDITNHNLINN